MMNLGFFSPLLPSVDAIMAGCPRVGPLSCLSLSALSACTYVLVSFDSMCSACIISLVSVVGDLILIPIKSCQFSLLIINVLVAVYNIQSITTSISIISAFSLSISIIIIDLTISEFILWITNLRK
jgi:hypothetical protein